MERKAVNSSGYLGTLYDGSRDRVIEQSKMEVHVKRAQLSEPVQCELISGNTEASSNLLRSIGIQDELRLSLLLNLTKRAGIAAIMDYSYQINEHTRFIYYSRKRLTEQLAKKDGRIQENTGTWNPLINATHMITSLTLGIDVIVVLQLPSELDIITKIDLILEKLCGVLLSDTSNILELSSIENKLLGNIVDTKVYSNIPALTDLFRVSDILSEIDKTKHNAKLCHPLSYTLESITSLYSRRMGKAATFSPLSPELNDNIEQHILHFRNSIKYAEVFLNGNVPKLLDKHLQHQLKEVRIQWSVLKDNYRDEINRFAKLIVDVRSGRVKAAEILQALHDDKQIALMNSVDELNKNIVDLERKGRLATDLRLQQLECENAAKRNLDKNYDTRRIERTLSNGDQCDRVSYSSDTSNKKKTGQLPKSHHNSPEEFEKRLDLRRTSDDSAYHTSESSDMKKSPSRKTSNYNVSNYSRSLSLTHPDTSVASSPSPSPPLPADEAINILLLGETGVGKSTFINAFANYLTFKSLEKAQSNEPMVLIPVSFIMTTGNNFEEHTIKFGEFDSANNEDFNTLGQSVTQHCKSYLFDLNHTDGKKMRIIDTPGFGDTRGLDQDDRNMEHILQYVSNLTHLNAICFLLKPNASRLSIFFRTCFTQLFSLLGPSACKNVLFCFTSARSTFFTPGNTAPLLKTMLESFSMNDIQFRKENTFCFDSESFRYLVALQNGIEFTDDDKHEYETSWSKSVTESNRLIDYIRKKLTAYHMEGGWQSIKHAQFEISHMIRPMLEAIRNILRNIILCKTNLSTEVIQLSSKALHRTATRCLSCKLSPRLEGKFWVISDHPHEISNKCFMCSCTVDQHVPIDYALDYKCWRVDSGRNQNEMNDMLDGLCYASAEFAHFLMHTACSRKDDQFFIGLVEIIEEENDLSKIQKLNQFNYQLANELEKVRILYEQRMSKMKSNQQSTELSAIYKLIKSVGEYPMIREQLVAVKRTQQMMMEQYEYEAQKI